MHPDDVADLVREQAVDIRDVLAARPDLHVTGVEHDAATIDIGFIGAYRSTGVATTRLVSASSGEVVRQEHHRGILLDRTRHRQLHLHLECTDYDCEPASVQLRDQHGRVLPPPLWPRSRMSGERRGVIPHPRRGGMFFCRPGTSGYHTLAQHADDPWDAHREGHRLAVLAEGILDDIHHRWLLLDDASRP